jgi:Cft2 family RNA processing exonuclease
VAIVGAGGEIVVMPAYFAGKAQQLLAAEEQSQHLTRFM